MNIETKTELTLSPCKKVGTLRVSVFVDHKLYDDMIILKGPIAEVQAYYDGKLPTLQDVRRIWRSKPRDYFYVTADANDQDPIPDEFPEPEEKTTYPLDAGVSDGVAYCLEADLMMLSHIPAKPIYAVRP